MRSLAVLVVTWGLCGCAGVDHARAEPSYTQSTAYDFRDEDISGDLDTPDGAYLMNEAAADERGGTATLSAGGVVLDGRARRSSSTRYAGSAPGAPVQKPTPAPADEPATETAPSGDDQTPAPPQKRLKVYTGSVRLQVANVEAAQTDVVTATEALGGYVSVKGKDRVTVRVPAARFFELVEQVKKIGVLLDETLEAKDVTAQAYELELRLDTARKSHARLSALLEKAEKVEDLLKIEAELRRLTEEIEVMQGQLRLLMDQVTMSTLTVMLYRAGPPPQQARTQSPFSWVNAVGPRRAWEMPTYNLPPGPFTAAPLETPARFLALGVEDFELRALSSEESRLWVRTFEVTGGALDFWDKALRKDFEEGRGLTLGDGEEVTLHGLTGRAYIVPTQVGQTDVKYFVAVFRQSGLFSEDVVVVELCSKVEQFDEDLAALRQSLR